MKSSNFLDANHREENDSFSRTLSEHISRYDRIEAANADFFAVNRCPWTTDWRFFELVQRSIEDP